MVKNKNEDSMVEFSVKELYTETKNSVAALVVKLDNLQTMLRDQERHGCGPAQEAMSKMIGIIERLGKMENESASASAVKESLDKSAENSKTTRLQWWAIIAAYLMFGVTLYATLHK